VSFPTTRGFVCTCTHRRTGHYFSAATPKGPCRECACREFTPEPKCKCGHGKKAHTKTATGHCHDCACKVFRPA
jgi:hypothetical protein